MEKYLKQMRDSTETDEQRIMRKYEEDSSHCANCGKWMPWWNTKPLCKECGNKEVESSDAELSDAEMDLANDEKKLAELESEKQNGEEEKRTFPEKQEKELKDEEELREEQGIKDEIKKLENKKKQLDVPGHIRDSDYWLQLFVL
ncbi:MAG: hypothetical protein E6K97_04710 [Thaumarchaeota archaeon]|nr:MAG: hypothetical protein E6K97_04710 [Nitrososphaerota archaeon]